MFNNLNKATLIQFYANIQTCEKKHTASNLSYFEFSMLRSNKLINAFQWVNLNESQKDYKINDCILIVGRWATDKKDRFQILKSKIVSTSAANDGNYEKNKPVQCKFSFSRSHNKK